MTKKRLDILIQERNPNLSRNQIQGFIMLGKVQVDGAVITKSGHLISEEAEITLDLQEPKYVSRAGLKLEHALDQFGIDVRDKVAMDAGLSTGGFTDCLLQRGIARVYGIDVGYGQVHEKIRNDPRVVVMERTNLRHLEQLPEMVDIVTLDLSFISVLKVMDAVCKVLKKNGILLVLIKPQFEAEKHQVGKGGIVRDETVYKTVIDKVTQGIESYGFINKGVIPSPITGTMGNKEYLSYFLRK